MQEDNPYTDLVTGTCPLCDGPLTDEDMDHDWCPECGPVEDLG